MKWNSAIVYSICAAIPISAATTEPMAFELSGMDWRHKVSPMAENFVVCLSGAPKGALDRIKQAAEKWNYERFNFTFATERCLSDPPDNKERDGINYISWNDINIKIGSAAAYPEKSARFFEWDKMVECDIEFDKSRTWHTGTSRPNTHENDLLTVAMHEFGHCLGLDHSDVRGAVMEEFLEKGIMRRNLHEDDIMGRNRIYGSPDSDEPMP